MLGNWFIFNILLKLHFSVQFSLILAWGFAFMIHNPEVLRRCHEEIDQIIGSDRIITLMDKPNLHYCNATIDVSCSTLLECKRIYLLNF